MRSRTLLVPAALAIALGTAGQAQGADFSTRFFDQPASSGLPVSGSLSEFTATSRGRVLIPRAWRKLSAPAGQMRFITAQHPACRYVVTYRIKSVIGTPQDSMERVTAALPGPSARHVLDSGERGSRAFRVVRQDSVGERVRVEALWNGVLTRRDDVVPKGQVAWSEIRVTAMSRPGDECHSGTYRQALGPTIGDSLAVARATLKFTRKR